jgi:glycosyl transferase family 87
LTAAAPHRDTRALARRRALDHALFGVVPILVTIWFLRLAAARHQVAVDFSNEYWIAGRRVLNGGNIYAWSHRSVLAGVSFPYPALTALAFVPLALLPNGVSAALLTAICLACVVATLRLLEVRDWRVWGVALLWVPVVTAWQTGNLTLVLALGLALIWRYRDRPMAAGVLAALVISLKPFVWPIAVWLLATRRYRAASACVAVAAAANLAAWLVGGFGGFGSFSAYLSLSSDVTTALYRRGYGVLALLAHLGVGRGGATVVEIAASVMALLAMCVFARRARELSAITICVVAMLIASPLVWSHYFALMLVPLALAWPRIGLAWFAPLVLWACPELDVAGWQVVLVWVTIGALAIALVDMDGRGRLFAQASAPVPPRQAAPAEVALSGPGA